MTYFEYFRYHHTEIDTARDMRLFPLRYITKRRELIAEGIEYSAHNIPKLIPTDSTMNKVGRILQISCQRLLILQRIHIMFYHAETNPNARIIK